MGRDDESAVVRPEDILSSLRGIGGFLGAAAVSPLGEILASAPESRVDMTQAAAFANNVLLHAKEASQRMGAGRTTFAYVEGTDAGFLACCRDEAADSAREQGSGPDDPTGDDGAHAHVHAILVLDRGGNLGLAKLRIGRAIELLADCYR